MGWVHQAVCRAVWQRKSCADSNALQLETLESRIMLTASNVIANYTGVLASATSQNQAQLHLTTATLKVNQTNTVLLDFDLKAAGTTAPPLDAAAVQIFDANNNLVSPLFSQVDVTTAPGGLQSVVIAALPLGNYSLTVAGTHGTYGGYELDVSLVGDVNGDHVVDRNDQAALRGELGMRAGQTGYSLDADTEFTGVITAVDTSLLLRNLGSSSTTVPLTLTAALNPSPTQSLADGTPLTTNPASGVTGKTLPGATVKFDVNGDGFKDGTVIAGADGSFTFPATLINGLNTLTVQATDALGQTQQVALKVSLNSTVHLVEGTHFRVVDQQTLIVPVAPSILQFTYANLNFALGAPFVNDAFEAALTNSAGSSPVYTIGAGHQAFFNMTKGLPPTLAKGVEQNSQTVSLDLTGLIPGSQITVTLRLVNDDTTTTTSVDITDIHVQSGGLPSGGTVGPVNLPPTPAYGPAIAGTNQDQPTLTVVSGITANGPVSATSTSTGIVSVTATSAAGHVTSGQTALISGQATTTGTTLNTPPGHGPYVPSTTMTLSSSAAAAGYALTNFASGFPYTSNIGPLGIGFLANNSVMVGDYLGNVRVFPNDNDGQSSGSAPIGQNYGGANSVGIAQVGTAFYVAEQAAGSIIQVNANGSYNQTIVSMPGATGLNASPDGHLFCSAAGGIWEVDPIAKTRTLFVSDGADGLEVSNDGSTLYAEVAAHIIGYNIASRARVFDSGLIANSPDGMALGVGALAGTVFVNTNGGTVVEVNLSNNAQTLIASGGSRGDFVEVDPTDGTLLLTQTDRILRLTAPLGAGFGRIVPNSIKSVTVNGVPVTSLDASGHFFISNKILPGQNNFVIVATDSSGAIAGTTLTLYGDSGVTNTASVVDVAGSVMPLFGLTSFNETSAILFSQIAVHNAGQTSIDEPLYVGVTHLSDASVQVLNPDGYTSTGMPYFDYSALVTGTHFNTGDTTGFRELSFYNPNKGQFSFDLVPLAQINHGPQITSTPIVTAVTGKTYTYPVVAIDIDGNPLTYSLNTAPAAMTINPGTGIITWAPAIADIGNQSISIVVTDGKGGSAEQDYTLTVTAPQPNHPPEFITTPVVDSAIGQPYVYNSQALSPDGDTLTYSISSGPAAMTINASTGAVTWTPTAADFTTVQTSGPEHVTLSVNDGHGGTATQSYLLNVSANPTDHAPVIISTPQTTGVAGTDYIYDVVAIDADHDPLTYSVVTAPTGVGIIPSTGVLDWANAVMGSYPITVKVDDGRGGSDKQSYTLMVSAVGTGQIHGMVYNDLNGNGNRDQIGGTTTTTSPTPGPITLTQISTTFNSPIAVEYYEPTNSILLSVNYSNGEPNNFDIVQADGSHVPFSAANGLTDEVYMASARTSDQGNFVPGDVFTGNGHNGQITRITNGGQTVINPWVVLPGSNGLLRGALAFDRTGVWNNDLIVATENGEIWTVNAQGVSTLIARTGSFLEGVGTVPNDPTRFGPLAGTILAGDEQTNQLFAISKAGVVTAFSVPVSGPETVNIVPANENFFGVDYGNNRLLGVSASDFAGYVGDILVSAENNTGASGLYNIYWDGSTVRAAIIPARPGSALPSEWEGSNFAPAGISQVAPVALEPALPNWTVYLDLNHDGVDDPGDPTTTTNSLGQYSFTALPAGNYTVREVPQAGWQTSEPSAGSYNVTVASQQSVNGIDFGNKLVNPTLSSNTLAFTSTPPTAAKVKSALTYQAVAVDADKNPVTYSLAIAPFGMTIDPATGIVTWTPTAVQAGNVGVTIRAQDTQGGLALQQFVIAVSNSISAPSITSTPTGPAVAGQPYHYAVIAVDPQKSPLTYALSQPPVGMSINPQTGVLSWTPGANQVGSVHVIITATDALGASASQTFDLPVVSASTNEPPSITSTPGQIVIAGQLYQYAVVAVDPNGDTLTYQLTTAPAGMTISATGLVTWIAPASEVGMAPEVAVQVSDGRGGLATQTYGLAVIATPVTHPPLITSTPPTTATAGAVYRYNPVVTDTDNNSLTYSLSVFPAGMSIDAYHGTITWTPTTTQIGGANIILKVQDGQGGVALQQYTIQVSTANHPPIITSTPTGPAVAGVKYQYAVVAIDPDGNSITYSLQSPPAGMVIDPATGILTWTPTTAQVGSANVVITASDGLGGTATQTYTLPVVATAINAPPTILSTPGTSAQPGQLYQYAVVATDPNGDPLSYQLTTAPAGITISATGLISWAPPASDVGLTRQVTILVSDTRGASATQSYGIGVVSQITEHAPVITSVPLTAAIVGNTYTYAATASDADNNLLLWSLDSAPAGMAVNPTTGTVVWQPLANQLGIQQVVLRVIDRHGGFDTQSFSISTTSLSLPPNITSSPTTTATVGVAYSYAVAATDPNGSTLSYSLVTTPAGMTINASTGLVSWTPVAAEVGNNNVAIRATNSFGQYIEQDFTIVVSSTADTAPPRITSTPPYGAQPTKLYTYAIIAIDPAGNPLRYVLSTGPVGMTINGNTGLVSWTPTAQQTGAFAVSVSVIDSAGASASQSYNVFSFADLPPVITSTPVLTATAGTAYVYTVLATDKDGSLPSFKLSAAPAGMTIDNYGNIAWNPAATDVGPRSVLVTVTDDFGLTATQPYTVTVTADITAPKVQIIITKSPASLNDVVNIQVLATDNVGVTGRTLTVDGNAVAVDANGVAAVKFTRAGDIAISATASDAAGNTGTATSDVLVINPADTSAPVTALTSPADGSTITSIVNVTGTVTDSNLLYYTLAIAPADGSGGFQEIYRGTSIVSNGVLGTFDPTMLADNSYLLRLYALNAGGHSSEQEVQLNVSGKLKLGNFALSFTDLQIPVTGIPITVTRTYDTLNASQSQDFGYGWRLEFGNTDLRTSVPAVSGDSSLLYNGFQPGTRVYVTVPGGKREGFTFSPKGGGGLFGFLGIYTPAFVADPGVTDTLSVDNYSISYYQGIGVFTDFFGDLPYNPADTAVGSGLYTLTTKTGTVYKISGGTGSLQSVTDNNGNKLTFSSAGIFSSTGVNVTFQRDPQGRISDVIDPDGNKIAYAYDPAGNLASVTDRDGNITQYVYRTDFAHYLDHVIDPLGRTGLKTNYGANGQLDSITNANGKTTAIGINGGASLETITDALGNPTTYGYDDRGNIVLEIAPDGGKLTRTFDANNHVLTETDALGHTTSYTYDNAGNKLTVTDHLGNATRYTYNQFGQILTTTDPLGNTVTNGYDGYGDPLSTTGGPEGAISFTYAASGKLASMTTAAGTTTYQYDGAGNLLQIVDPLGHVTSYTYDANGNQLTMTTTVTIASVPTALVTQMQYDAAGRLIKTTNPDSTVTQSKYDAAGNVIATIDALGRVTNYVYDAQNELLETDYPDGTNTTSQYDANGNVVADTDQSGNKTQYVYNTMNRQIEVIYPDGSTTKGEYDLVGDLTASTDQRGNRTQYEYDSDGNQVETIFADGSTISTAYDNTGRMTASIDQLGHATKYGYSASGQLLRTTYADATTLSNTYDEAGRLIAKTDQDGNTTHYQYNAGGRLVAVVDALGQTTKYAYDQAGDQTSLTDANNHLTQYQYNSVGRQVAAVLPSSHQSKTAYNAVGDVISTTDFDGNATASTYDSLDRLTSETLADGSNVAYTYTPTGQRASVTDSRGVTAYSYDLLGQMLSQTNPDGSYLHYTYDSAGNRASLITPVGTTSYTYDSLNRLATVTSPEGGVTTYTYDAAGNLITTHLPDGSVETRKYDLQNRLVFVGTATGGGMLIDSFAYTLDGNGNRTKVVEDTGRTVNYTYDALGRLTEEKITDAPAGNRTMDYTYDAAGNRLTLVDSVAGTTTYTYDANDELVKSVTGTNTATYAYDTNGNSLSISLNGVAQTTYQWDDQNRLIASTTTAVASSATVTYTYDADGNRASVTSNGQTTFFLVDSNGPLAQVVEEYVSGGAALVSYVYGNALISQNRAGVQSFFHVDAQGSTRALTNAAGAVTDRYVYDAFGQILSQTGSTQNSYLYDGQQWNPTSHTYYLRARYMDPATGRFLSADPLHGTAYLPLSLNRFIYALENPVSSSDPTGKQDDLEELEVAEVVEAGLEDAEAGSSGSALLLGEHIAAEIEGVAVEEDLALAEGELEADITAANPVEPLTQAESRAISRIENNIQDHLTDSDLSGALRDLQGNPVPKPGGGFYDHLGEVDNALRGLLNAATKLQDAANPAAQAAVDQALEAIINAEKFLFGG